MIINSKKKENFINNMNINNNHKLFSPMNDQPYIKLVVIFYLLKSIL